MSVRLYTLLTLPVWLIGYVFMILGLSNRLWRVLLLGAGMLWAVAVVGVAVYG